MTDVVRLVEGDFLDHADEFTDVGFCFLDAEKDVYEACYDIVVPKMVPGAILVADNATSHREDLQSMMGACSPMNASTRWSPPSARANSSVAGGDRSSQRQYAEVLSPPLDVLKHRRGEDLVAHRVIE